MEIGERMGMVWWEWERMKTLHFHVCHPQQFWKYNYFSQKYLID